MPRGGRAFSQAAPRRAARILKAVFFSLILCSCFNVAEDTRSLWPGVYRGVADEPGSGFSEMSVDQVGKKDFSFFLRLIQENGYSREISGKASYKGRRAVYSQDGIELALSLEEGSAPAIIVEDGATKALESEGFKRELRLARESIQATVDGSGETLENEASPPPAAAPEPGSAFRFGYYLPEGADPAADALPESFAFLFFDKNGMTAKELSMFEGMTDEGRLLGAFTVRDESLLIENRDKKTGKKITLEWKRQAGNILVSDSGQRFFFWKDNL